VIFRFSEAPFNVDLIMKMSTPQKMMRMATILIMFETGSGHI
jgi:hypothetical protein